MRKIVFFFLIVLLLASPAPAKTADLYESYTPTRYEWLEAELNNHADLCNHLPKYMGVRITTSVQPQYGEVWSNIYAPRNIDEKDIARIKKMLEIGIYMILSRYDWTEDINVKINVYEE